MKQGKGSTGAKEGYHWFRGWRKPSAAQRRVLDELLAGGTNAEIAGRLGISEDGVKWHLGELREELGLSDRRELAEWWEAERQRANVLAPLAALWRTATQRAPAAIWVGGFAALSLAVGWLAYSSLDGGDEVRAGTPAARTSQPAAAVPFVPTPSPTPDAPGALLIDVASGDVQRLPGRYSFRRWLDEEALRFVVVTGTGVAVIDAEGEVQVMPSSTGVSAFPVTGGDSILLWDRRAGELSEVDTRTLEAKPLADFGSVEPGFSASDVSAAAGKVALADGPKNEVTVYDLDGSGARPIFTAEGEEGVSRVAWSSDGRRLIVQAGLRQPDGQIRGGERFFVYSRDGERLMQGEGVAGWLGAQTLSLRTRSEGVLSDPDFVDVEHGAALPLRGRSPVCVSPDSRYALFGAQVESTTTPAKFRHELRDLVQDEVIARAEVEGFYVNCDWTADGSKVVLSPGGK